MDQIHDNSPRVHEGWTGDKISFARPLYARIVRNTKKLYGAGVHYALGTDSGSIPEASMRMSNWSCSVKDIGLIPSQAIMLATKMPPKRSTLTIWVW